MQQPSKTSLKLVIVGDGAVGKTSLLYAYTKGTGQLPEDYTPTIFDTYSANVPVDGKTVNLTIFDTAGQEEYSHLRSLAYPQTDVFLIAFSIVSPHSVANIRTVWAPDINRHRPQAVKILIGTKLDLRESPAAIAHLAQSGLAPVSTTQGQSLAKEIGAAAYVECSSVTMEGVHQVFAEAITAALYPKKNNKKEKNSKCIIC